MEDDIKNPDMLDDVSAFEEQSNESIIKVIGVGGGGGNAVNYMFKQNIPNVNFVVCNTDEQALKDSPVPKKLVLGYEITGGRGAGNVPEVGRQCAEASADDVRKLFDDQTEMVFITAGMGGGTGTGAAPVIARIAKDAGMLTIGIVTVPFVFEGEKKILKALDGAMEMQKYVDALLVINNENLIELYPDLNFFTAFEKADDTLANAARSISDIIAENLYINVDFQDVKTVLKDSGTAIISTAEGEGENRISEAIHNALHSPLLKTHDIKTAKRLLLKFGCNRHSEHPVKASEIEAINQFTAQLPKTIDVKWGIGDYPELGDKVRVTVLASGFDVTLREGHREDGRRDEGKIVFGFDEKEDNPREAAKSGDDDARRIAEVYGNEKVLQSVATTNKMRYAVLKPSQMDDDELIARIESQPALNRDPRFLNEINTETVQSTAAEQPRKPQQPEAGAGFGITF